MLFEPVDALGVEVVRRLVEQKHVRFLKEQTAERYASALTTRKVLHAPVSRRASQCVHSTFQLGVDIPCIRCIDNVLKLSLTVHELFHLFGIFVVFRKAEFLIYLVIFFKCIIDVTHSVHNIFLDSFCVVERRVLREVSNRISRRPYHFTLILLIDAGNNLHESRLTGSIETNDTYFCPVKER